MLTTDQIVWAGFGLLILLLLALDLGVFHKKSHTIGLREALFWSGFWILVAVAFNVFIFYWYGKDLALAFAASYVVERTLSVDNLFVFLLIFSYFKVPSAHQYKVLFWGIVAALVLRGMFIISGIALIERFHFVIYIFGAFLIYTGLKLFMRKPDGEDDPNLSNNCVLRICRRFLPMTDQYSGGNFFVRHGGKLFATPLFATLLVVETSDVVFALDSVPAVLGITLNPFVAYTSNIFAILGLRALYFALAGCMLLFHYLSHGITFILIFIGAKMLLSGFYEVPTGIALGVILAVLAGSIILSIALPKAKAGETKIQP